MVRSFPTCYDQNFSSCSWDRDSAAYDAGYSTTFCSQVCAHGGGRVGTLSMWVCHKLIKQILLLVRSREIVVEEVKRTTANMNYILHYPKEGILHNSDARSSVHGPVHQAVLRAVSYSSTFTARFWLSAYRCEHCPRSESQNISPQ